MTLTRDDVLHARGMEEDMTIAELEAKTAENKEKETPSGAEAPKNEKEQKASQTFASADAK